MSDNQSDTNEHNLIRNELCGMSFEDILKLKEKVGSKAYYETISNKSLNQTNSMNSSFKRENKNRPREMSAKKPVSQFRPVYSIKKNCAQRVDPRFEESCGAFNEKIFKSTFSFLDGVRDNERKQLRKQLKKTSDDSKRKDIQFLLQRMDNQKKAEQEKTEKLEIVKKIKTTFNDNDNNNDNKQKYFNKSTIKRISLAEKFKKLKKSGKLEKYLQKKRKRNTTRDRKKVIT